MSASKKTQKFDNTQEKLQYLTVFSQFHAQYINLLNILKKIVSKLDIYNNISPQETLCLLQIYDFKSQKHTGDSGLNNLAKRTNNIADHLMFQLNNLARKNLVVINVHDISLTSEGNYIIESIANELQTDVMQELQNNLKSINKCLASI